MRLSGIPQTRPWLTWLILVLLIVAQGVGVTWSRAPEWLGWAPATAGAVETVTIFGLSVLCVSAAWLASLPRVFHYEYLVALSARRPHAYPRLVLLYVGSAGLAGFAVCALAVSALPLALGGSLAGPTLTLALSTTAALASAVVWTSLGLVLGKIRPAFAALAVAAVAPYACFVIGAYQGDGPWRAFFLADSRGFAYFTPDPVSWAGRSVFWLALAVVLTATVLRAKRTRTVGLWIASFAAALTLLSGTAVVAIPGADDGRCLDGEPVVCTDVAHSFALPTYSEAAHEAVIALPPKARPAVVAQNARVADASPKDGFVLVLAPSSGFTQPANIVDRELFLTDFGRRLFGVGHCINQSDVERRNVRNPLEIWWRQQFALPLNGSTSIGSTNFEAPDFAQARALAAEFNSLEPPVREAWLTDHLMGIVTCRDIPAEFP